MKACVAVTKYFVPGQTFVNRHIDLLYEGNTVIVASTINDLREIDARFYKRRIEKRSTFDVLTAPFKMVRNTIVHGTSRVPFGQERAQLMDFLRQEKPDVILAEFGTQGVVLAPIANALNIPMFCYFRGSDASSRIQHKHVQKAYRKMMPRLMGVFSVSQFLLDNLASKDIVHPNARVIPSGVDVRAFAPAEKQPNSAMAVGRMVEKKAPLTTIRAFAEARKTTPDATLTMIGDGELLEDAQALVSTLGLEDCVTLTGALPHEDVREIMKKTEVFLQHSLTANNGNTEGLPTAIQEAMAAGCVCVSTRHAGIPEAIDHGVTGYMVEEHDEAGYTRHTVDVLAMTAQQKSDIGAKAREVACERFDNAILLTKLEDAMRNDVLAAQK